MNTLRALEMKKLHDAGLTHQQIADKYGISRASVGQTIRRVSHKKLSSLRGRKINIEKIKYKHIYEYFKTNIDESCSSLATKVLGYSAAGGAVKMFNFIYGEHDVHFTVSQMRALCDTIGVTFEELLEER